MDTSTGPENITLLLVNTMQQGNIKLNWHVTFGVPVLNVLHFSYLAVVNFPQEKLLFFIRVFMHRVYEHLFYFILLLCGTLIDL